MEFCREDFVATLSTNDNYMKDNTVLKCVEVRLFLNRACVLIKYFYDAHSCLFDLLVVIKCLLLPLALYFR